MSPADLKQRVQLQIYVVDRVQEVVLVDQFRETGKIFCIVFSVLCVHARYDEVCRRQNLGVLDDDLRDRDI